MRGRHLFRRDGGQGLVEFALVIPVFLMLLFGLIDGSRLVFQHSILSQAAREGARTASVEASWMGKSGSGCGTTGGPTCPANATALKADVLAATNRMIQPFTAVTDSNLYLRCDPAGGTPTGDWTGPSGCANPTTGNVASVRVESTFMPITPIVSGILGSIPISAAASMVIN